MYDAKKRFIAVDYKLYTVSESGEELIEETTNDCPFTFVSNLGVALESFEERVQGLSLGSFFDFILNKDEAYGERNDSRIKTLSREIFSINGHFDHENIYVGAVIPLQNEDGDHFSGRVISIDNNGVTIDLNHPLAGFSLHFKGSIIENRPASDQEIAYTVKHLSGGGCNCGDKNCGCGDGSCDCSHGHHCH